MMLGKTARESPFLILLDSEASAIFALAVAEKACKPWVAKYVFDLLNELGCSVVKVALKSGASP